MAIKPAGHRVLVLPDKVNEKEGSLFLPQEVRARMGEAQIFGTVVAVGANAFKAFDDGHAWANVGDRVAFAKYGGFNIQDPEDKVLYRLLNDEDICAVITNEEAAQ
jgi:co-chaperonin GroES (HSP10)